MGLLKINSLSSISTQLRSKTMGAEKLLHPAVPNLESARAILSSMFDKHYSLNEANEAVRAYREAFLAPDTVSFLNKTYTQLLKDYNFKPNDINCEAANLGRTHAAFSPFSGIKINSSAIFDCDVDRAYLFKCMAHELKHAAQHRIEAGTNFEEYIKATTINSFRNINESTMAQRILRQNNGDKYTAMCQFEAEYRRYLLPCIRNAERIPRGTELYRRGLDYIENQRNYIYSLSSDKNSPEYIAYKSQLLEREAFKAADMAGELYSMLTHCNYVG